MRLVCKTTLVLIAPMLLVSACNESTSPSDLPERTTVSFTGTLAPSGSEEFSFTVKTTGTVNVSVLNMLGVDTPIQGTVGLALGTWDGTTCTLVVRNENATFGTVMRGSALKGEWCIRLYDVGMLTETVNYEIEVDHP